MSSLGPDRYVLHYRIVDKIGEGGMGEVWRARDTLLDRDVAIKVLPPAVAADPERRARFEREAKTLAALSHPNIATIHGLHTDGDLVFLAMELVEGEDLGQRLARGPLELEDTLNVLCQVAEALVAAHEQGIVHRDLKPANIVVAGDGTVKVLDFGLAKILGPTGDDSGGDPAASPTLTSLGTQAGMILGTAAYMSPEQARGRAVDRRADLWSLGVVLHEMLSGRRLFDGESVSDTLAAVLRADVDFADLPARTPAALRRILRRCLERDPNRRLRDAGEVRFVAEEVARGAGDADLDRSVPSGVSRRRVAAWLLVPVALLLGVVAGVMWGPSKESDTRVVRALVPPPPGGRIFLSSRQPGPPALSPDGSRIAFVARDADRSVRLWIRDLDRDESVVLEGTDGASYPFWSPDGGHIGFFADRSLKRIDLEGHAVLTLCEAPFGKGGSWNAAGQIVFAPSYNTPIHVVSADGGPSTALTRLDESVPENSHRFPFFLPDGRHFLYFARVPGTSGGDSRIRIGTLDGKDAGVLVESPTQAEYRAGHLLYSRGDVLLARPFDAASRTFAGEPFAVAAGVDSIAGAERAVFSASEDGRLVYMVGDSRQGHAMVWLDRTGDRLSTMPEQTLLQGVSISPDGTKVAAEADGSIWVFDVDRGTRRRVTFDQDRGMNPVWTPDGKTLIYRAHAKRFLDIFSKAADGSGEARLLVTSDADKITNDVSSDGRFLAYTAGYPVRGFDIWILPLDPEAEAYEFIATPYDEEEARFSPDGRYLAYQSNETGQDEIFITSFPDKKSRIQVSTEGGLYPRWSDDGTELYYQSSREEVIAVAVRTTSDGIELGRPEMLFFLTTPSYGNYDVHDGRFLVETDLEGGAGEPLHLLLNWPALGK